MRFSGASYESVESVLGKVREIVQENKGEIRIAKDQRENDLLWNARKVRSTTKSTLSHNHDLMLFAVYSRNIGVNSC